VPDCQTARLPVVSVVWLACEGRHGWPSSGQLTGRWTLDAGRWTLATLAGLTALTGPQHSPIHPPIHPSTRRIPTATTTQLGSALGCRPPVARHTQRPSNCSDLSGLSDLMPAGDSSQAAGCRALMDLRALAMMAELPNGCNTSGCGCVSVRKSHIILPAVHAVPVSTGRHPCPGLTSCRGIQATELIDFFSTFFFFYGRSPARGGARGGGPAEGRGTCHCLRCPANGATWPGCPPGMAGTCCPTTIRRDLDC
jgi:hypothetical protein